MTNEDAAIRDADSTHDTTSRGYVSQRFNHTQRDGWTCQYSVEAEIRGPGILDVSALAALLDGLREEARTSGEDEVEMLNQRDRG